MTSLVYRLPHTIIYNAYRLLFPTRFARQQERRNKVASKNENSLQGFDKHKCIFIHIPKAAGVSLANKLFGDLGGGHIPIYKYYLVYSPNEFKELFKFSIVRNPWDRLVSAYFFLKQGGFNEVDEAWFEDNIAHYETFDDFVKNWLTASNIYKFIHFVPQYEFLMIGNTILVDKIYKFEEMDQTQEDLGQRLAITLDNTHSNKTHLRDAGYRQYYTEESRKIVERIYQKDIRLFGYVF